MSQEFYIQLVITVGTLLLHYMKTRSDVRFSRKRNDESIVALTKKIDSVEKIVKEDRDDNKFRVRLESAISKKAFDVITSNTELELDPSAISILNMLQIKINKFAVYHSTSPYRTKETSVENYIDIEFGTIMEDIKQVYNGHFKEKYLDKSYYDFILANTDITTFTKVMIQRLTENGLDKEQYINLFVKYIDNLLKEHTKGYKKWIRRKK